MLSPRPSELIIDALLRLEQGGPDFHGRGDQVGNSQGAPVVACDTFDVQPIQAAPTPCIQADLTVTIGFAKIGLVNTGRMYTGVSC